MSMFNIKLFTTIFLVNTTTGYLHFTMYKNIYKKNYYLSNTYIVV